MASMNEVDLCFVEADASDDERSLLPIIGIELGDGDASLITVGFVDNFDKTTFDDGTEQILIFSDEQSFSSSVIVICCSEIVKTIE